MCIFHDIFSYLHTVGKVLAYYVYFAFTNPTLVAKITWYVLKPYLQDLHYLCPFYIMKEYFGIQIRDFISKDFLIEAAQTILRYTDVTLQYGQSFDMLSFSYILDIISMLQGDL